MIKELLLVTGVFLGTLFTAEVTKTKNTSNLKTSKTEVSSEKPTVFVELPSTRSFQNPGKNIKPRVASKTITLQAFNTLSFRGPVTADSVARFQKDLFLMSTRLSDDDIIYVVMDTPGGSIQHGFTLIQHLQAVPQEIHTITLMAASMGFQIVQSMGKRLITPTGLLMSHRAKGGVQGQFNGEIESRYTMTMRRILYMESISAKRMGLSLEEYEKLIKDELWVSGFDAIEEGVADEMVNVTCGKSLSGVENVVVRTLFGSATLTFSKCPIIRYPLGVDTYSILDKEKKEKVIDITKKAFIEKENYIKNYILTKEHFKYFK